MLFKLFQHLTQISHLNFTIIISAPLPKKNLQIYCLCQNAQKWGGGSALNYFLKIFWKIFDMKY